MAENTDSQVVKFVNEQVRPIADKLHEVYWKAKVVVQNYNANNVGSAINKAGAELLLADGSETDGRSRLTGGDVYNMVTALGQFIAFMEGSSVTTADRRDVITKAHVRDAV